MEVIINQQDWCNLLPDLITSIARKLSPIDCLRFRNVCSHWQQVMKSNDKHNLMPWLFLSYRLIEGEVCNNFNFLSMADGDRLFKLPLKPVIDYQTSLLLGSSHGWLIIMDKRFDMHMVNPLSGHHIPLPFLWAKSSNVLRFNGQFDDLTVNNSKVFSNEFDTIEDRLHIRDNQCGMFRKGVLSAAPVLSPIGDGRSWEFTVMMILGNDCNNRVCFAKAGDSCWTVLPDSHFTRDIIMHSNKSFYTLNKFLAVEGWEPCGASFKSRLVSPRFPDKGTREFVELMGQYWNYSGMNRAKFSEYLVETTGGELLIVIIWKGGHEVKLLTWDNEGKWKNVNSLGEQVAFLGHNHSVCLPASACPELWPNSIYHADSFMKSMKMLPLFVDDEKTRCVPLLQPIKFNPDFSPVWFSPTMNEDDVVIPQDQPDEILEKVGFMWKT